jgi:phage-related protein
MSYSSNKSNMSASTKQALHNFKMETAREVGVQLNEGYNGELTSKQAGSIGGQMVKKLVQQAENNLK